VKFIPSRNVPPKIDHPRLKEGVEIDLEEVVIERLVAAGLGTVAEESKSTPKVTKPKKKKPEMYGDVEMSPEPQDLLEYPDQT